MKNLFLIITAITFVGCTIRADTQNKAYCIQQIFKAEKDFNNLCQSKGIAEAFSTFADSNAVIKRENDSLIIGKENIKNYYSNPKYKSATVTWKPDAVEVSKDGFMASTYGNYVWTVTDSVGNKKEYKGVFHTVWKRQKDGTWKYIWD